MWKKFCRDDDAKAFESVYYALANKLLRFCIFHTGQQEVAEEIVSEVFVRCWNNRKNLIEVNYPEMYLYRAVKNESLKHKQKNIPEFVEIEDPKAANNDRFTDRSDPSGSLERKDLKTILDSAIQTLPLQARMVFVMIKEDGLRYKEVADILGISPRTVQTQLFRAIEKLRGILKDYHQAEVTQNSRTFISLLLLAGSVSYLWGM